MFFVLRLNIAMFQCSVRMDAEVDVFKCVDMLSHKDSRRNLR